MFNNLHMLITCMHVEENILNSIYSKNNNEVFLQSFRVKWCNTLYGQFSVMNNVRQDGV